MTFIDSGVRYRMKTPIQTIFETSRGKHRLNPYLVAEKGLDQAAVDRIAELHRQKDLVFDRMETENDPELVLEVTLLEFKLQKEWGFPLDSSFHRWFEVPRCSCAKLDNIDTLGVPGWKSINEKCIWHGIKL